MPGSAWGRALIFGGIAGALGWLSAFLSNDWQFLAVIAGIAAALALGIALLSLAAPTLKELSPGSGNAPAADAPAGDNRSRWNAALAERISQARTRLNDAKTALGTADQELANALNLAAGEAGRDNTIREKTEARDTKRVALNVATFELDSLMSGRRSGLSGPLGSMTFVQYLVFGSLSAFVLYYLMKGIASSPPPGTTPRSMITLLVSVVTVGIALILVLSSIVAEKVDDKRFAQGKEVLTALLGVLGTIVGFYFGTSQEPAGGFTFEPITVQMEGGKPVSATTRVAGGKAPYYFDAKFTPDTIKPDSGKSDDNGNITLKIEPTKDLKVGTPISLVLTVTDSVGKTGRLEQKALATVKAPAAPQK